MGSFYAQTSQLGFKLDRALKPEETLALFRLWREEGEEHRRAEIIEGNMPLVVWVTKRFYQPHVDPPFVDAFAEGCLGLVHATDRFDLAKEVNFATYATYWITCMLRKARQRNRIIHIPFNLQHRKMSEKQKKRRSGAANAILFTDVHESKFSDATRGEFDPSTPDERIELDRREHVESGAAAVLDAVDPADRVLLSLYAGLDGLAAKNAKEIGKILGLTRTGAVDRIKKAAGRAKRELERSRKDFSDAI